MDSKTLWTVVIVAIVASLITSFVTVKLTGNIIYTPNYIEKNQTAIYTNAEVDSKFTNVKANSCDADGNCEINRISAANKTNVNYKFAASPNILVYSYGLLENHGSNLKTDIKAGTINVFNYSDAEISIDAGTTKGISISGPPYKENNVTYTRRAEYLSNGIIFYTLDGKYLCTPDTKTGDFKCVKK